MIRSPSLLLASSVATLLLAAGLHASPLTLDPTTIARTGRPNDRLICPEGVCAAPADAPAPVLDAPAERVLAAWRAVIGAEPRTTLLAFDESELRIVAEQRSRIFGFVDTIAIKVLPLANGRSTFAAYSRSNTGYWDVGVNASRLDAWIGALLVRLGANPNRP